MKKPSFFGTGVKMTVQRVDIKNIRNISSESIEPSPEINVIYGENGSGKTSILEALYMAGMARSFRSNNMKSVIKEGQDSCVVFLQAEVPIGVQRKQGGDTVTIRVSGEKVNSISELASIFPVQIINPDVFGLLNDLPAERRKFVDWGVFHVKHSFFLKIGKGCSRG